MPFTRSDNKAVAAIRCLAARLLPHRGVALHVGEEEADVVCGGVVLEHVVEAPLTRARRLVLRLGEVLVQDVAHRRVVHHPRPAVLAEVRPGDLEGGSAHI